ncbi:MAG: hypothetical protein ABJF04_19730 [Reichenbachiella sp.]|uniref:hypothetical protein n=2 Tax=Reichenbachiella sp. TaxID=2184521 RepID=UPI003267DFF6
MNKPYICDVMENDIDFKTYLISKKIDPDQFKSAESELFEKLAIIFEQSHPDSFTAQKLFLINPIRRKYLLKEQEGELPSKPKMKFKPKIG